MKSEQTHNLPTRILVVDDDPTVANGLIEPLSRYGVLVDSATNLNQAAEKFESFEYEVILVEAEFESMPGIALIQKWRQHKSLKKRSTAYIIMLGSNAFNTHEALMHELRHLEEINKPFSYTWILTFLSRGLHRRNDRLLRLQTIEKLVDAFKKISDVHVFNADHDSDLASFGVDQDSATAEIYERGGNLEAALSILDKALNQDKNSLILRNAKARVLLDLGKHDLAIPILERLNSESPINMERLTNMARAYLKAGQVDKAKPVFQEILKLSPEIPSLKFKVVQRLGEAGFMDDAVAFARENCKPGEVLSYYNSRAIKLARDGQRKKALQEYITALHLYPNYKHNSRIYFNMALICCASEEVESLERGREYLIKCLNMAPEFDKARAQLEQVNQSLEKLKETQGKKAS